MVGLCIDTYLDVATLGTHLVELENAYFRLVQTKLVNNALGLGAVRAVALGEDGDEVLGDELFSGLLGGHFA